MSLSDFRIAPNPPMAPSALTGKDGFTTKSTHEGNHTHFETEDESISVGTWECAPCREVVESWPVHELMAVVAGAVTLPHKDGRRESFGPGDTFYIAKGQYAVWEITERLRKMYMIAAWGLGARLTRASRRTSAPPPSTYLRPWRGPVPRRLRWGQSAHP